MTLDYTTLAVFGLLQTFAVAFGFSLILLVLRRQPILRMWVAAMWLMAIALLLAVLRPQMPELLSILAGNACAALGNILLLRGIGLHVGRRVHWAVLAASAVALLLVLLVFSTVRHDLGVRIVAFATMQIAWDAWVVLLLLRDAPPALRMSCRLAAAAFAADALFQGMRLVIPLLGDVGQDLLGTGQPMAMAYLGGMLLTLAECFSLVLLIVQRLMVDLRRSARIDGLTGLLNRTAMVIDASEALRRCQRRRQPCAVAMFDLDHFKRINDSRGHEAGDSVLRHFAGLAGEVLDGQHHLLGRWGGEEFVLVLPGCTLPQAVVLAGRIREALAAAPVPLPGAALGVTTSVGVAAADGGQTLEQVVAAADAALYRAKTEGRDRVLAA